MILLNALKEGQSNMAVYNSHLSEYAVSGFEYGYAFEPRVDHLGGAVWGLQQREPKSCGASS